MSNKFFLWVICTAHLFAAPQTDILTLSKAYEKALKNESQILAQQYRTEAAQEGIEQAYAQLYPQIRADISVGYNKYQPNYPTPEVSEPYQDIGVSAYIPVFRPELYVGLRQAKNRYEGAKYEYQRYANTLGLELAKAYFNFVRAQKNLVLARSLMEANEAKYNQLNNMLRSGLSTRMDALESKVAYDQSRAEFLAEEQRHRVARMTLEFMIGEKITDNRIAEIPLEGLNPDALTIAAYDWNQGLESNPDVKLAEQNLKVTQDDLSIRRWSHYPVADFQISGRKTETKDTSLREDDLRALLVLSVPIYQGGYTQSRIREGMKLESAAIEELNYYKREAKLKLESYLSEQRLMIESVKAIRETEYSAQLYLTSVEQGYERGLKSLFDLLEARSKLYQARRDLIDAVYNLVVNQLSLMDVTGTLSSERIYEIERKLNLLGS
ncbi:hypothetical protein CCZ01_02825 [Helicobacter monodelphidis]|uniref:TolC family protein n=1 Tax=Helicobacter sp. 15-1451 TaxID=2004995 RepID=UPI000DCF58DA|nr:TolC family protein [Helicobacter sp. 15-1451]RAX58367.1 hypothetical protein CCZ01_02825 [Helicobacter sp. 15-1451]